MRVAGLIVSLLLLLSAVSASQMRPRDPLTSLEVLDIFRKSDAIGMFTPPSLRGAIRFPGFDGGGEWGGAAFDPDTALLYVNANEMPWIVRLIPNNDTSLYNHNCASCHGDVKTGTGSMPSLEGIGERRSRDEIATIIRQGTGRMPGFPEIGARNIDDLVDFLVTGRDKGNDPKVTSDPNWLKYRNEGYTLFRDPDEYPPHSTQDPTQ